MKREKSMSQSDSHEELRKDDVKINYDIRSFKFHDLDLEMAVSRLSESDQAILILTLMGHKQRVIGALFSLSRSVVSKRLGLIKKELRTKLTYPN